MTPDTKAESFVAVTRKIVQILRYLQRLTHLDISFSPIDSLEDLPPTLKSLSLVCGRSRPSKAFPRA